VRDFEAILEAIADIAPRTRDPEILTEYARNAIARTLCHLHKGDDGRLHCITLEPTLEQTIGKGLERTDHGTVLTLPPKLQTRIVGAIGTEVEKATTALRGRNPVLLVPPQIRLWVRRMLEIRHPAISVLSFNEVVRGFEVESHGMVVLADES
jgi:flagellar biosynthesis protein FlhA